MIAYKFLNTYHLHFQFALLLFFLIELISRLHQCHSIMYLMYFTFTSEFILSYYTCLKQCIIIYIIYRGTPVLFVGWVFLILFFLRLISKTLFYNYINCINALTNTSNVFKILSLLLCVTLLSDERTEFPRLSRPTFLSVCLWSQSTPAQTGALNLMKYFLFKSI